MISAIQIISTYEAVLNLTGQMLKAAQAGEWDKLTELERDCRNLIEILMVTDKQPLVDKLQHRKAEIIRQVLSEDAEIRNLTVPWMAQLGYILGSADRSKRLQQAYGSDQA